MCFFHSGSTLLTCCYMKEDTDYFNKANEDKQKIRITWSASISSEQWQTAGWSQTYFDRMISFIVTCSSARNNANKQMLLSLKKIYNKMLWSTTSRAQREICQTHVCVFAFTHITHAICWHKNYNKIDEIWSTHRTHGWPLQSVIQMDKGLNNTHTQSALFPHIQSYFTRNDSDCMIYIVKAMGFWWIVQSRNPTLAMLPS